MSERDPPSGSAAPSGSRGGPYSLMIRNVMQSVRIADLKELFGRYGRVNDVYQPLNRARGGVHNYAFVKFDEREAAERAVAGLDNTTLHDGCVGNGPPRPEEARPPPPFPPSKHTHTHSLTHPPPAALFRTPTRTPAHRSQAPYRGVGQGAAEDAR